MVVNFARGGASHQELQGNCGLPCAWAAFEQCLSCGQGACNTMGTASTMAVLAEVLGLMVPGAATIPARSIAWSIGPFTDRALRAIVSDAPATRPEDPQSWRFHDRGQFRPDSDRNCP